MEEKEFITWTIQISEANDFKRKGNLYISLSGEKVLKM